MNRFYIENSQINKELMAIVDSKINSGTDEIVISKEGEIISDLSLEDIVITIEGEDVNHIRNVLRLKKDEKVVICNGQGYDFYCIINEVATTSVKVIVESVKKADTELPVKMYLFQGLPKKDKMELIIQKAVELGVYEIIPVKTKRSVVKIEDAKKENKKLQRWQSIAESAAKQSRRGIIPKVHKPVSYEDALKLASELECKIIPFELHRGKEESKKTIKNVSKAESVGIFVGPEGGFEDIEVEKANNIGAETITLGNRILRTETAGITVLSLIMFECEE